jgi:spermidine synthase
MPGDSEAASATAGQLALSRVELRVTVFVTGASVMVIEILGTRIIGPVLGVSLFVWSSLLAVTLGSLATGYYTGGLLVDRTPTPRLLGWVVVGSGALLGLVPLLSQAVLRLAEQLGPRGGSLVGATLLFAPCLIALGMTGPVAVRLGVRDVRETGHGVGSVYAISTAGSLVGTLVTGFVLVPALEIDGIVVGTAALLVLTGAASLVRRRQLAPVAAIIVPLVALRAPTRPLPSGMAVVDRSHSLYGVVEVIDDSNRGVRFLRIDHSIMGVHFLRDGGPGFSFIHLLEAIRFLRPAAKDLLQIGLGSGSLPAILQARGMNVDVVEIDPAMVLFARQYFHFAPRGETYVEDARTFLAKTERRYDLVVHDTFTGGTTPEHLLSVEVVRRIGSILRPGGVLELNLVGYYDGPKAEASFAVARTLRAVFARVRVFRDSALDDRPDAPANLIFFASNDVLEFDIPADASFDDDVCADVLRSFRRWEVLECVPDGPVITDAQNPLARLQLSVAEDHFHAMNELLPADVWRRY